MPFRNAPRLDWFDYRGGYRYFLTICTRERRRLFTHQDVVNPLVSQLRQCSTTTGMSVTAYCFMPDHVHLLAEGAMQEADFREFVRLYKQRSSFSHTREHGVGLWQRSYFERVLRRDEDTVRVAKYILDNPVRAGLASDPLNYPFSGSFTLEMRDLIGSLDGRRV